MPVNLLIKSGHVSNKTKVNITDIAYSPVTLEKHKAYILKPKIDKISITYAVNDIEDQKGIKTLLWNAVKDESSPHFQNAVFKKGSPKRYGTNVNLIDPTSKKSVLIQADPNKAGNRFLRFEFNPSKLGKTGMAFFRDHLPEFLAQHYTYKSIAEDGRITRIDIACDLIDVPMAMLVYQGGKPKKQIVYIGENGEIETIYPAKKSATKPSDVKMYDKKQERLDKGHNPQYGQVPHTRLEVRKETILPIAKLAKLQNPFKKIAIFAPGGGEPPEQDHHWKLFFEICRIKGIQAALNILPKELQSEYESALKKAKSEFWRPGKLWSFWSKVLDASGLLDISE